ncbi:MULTISPECIES: carbohydrate ABC transporter permease [unclassified Isoptericola]|uniref:carbohydrate ABC transporter permease n=1 Tax=unclassified Isoptericola TaxID=2623355 RepID=UPI0027134E16|nr:MULTISPECIES: sugar ABC transporter permease [unclassified Isoptericola]MDO8145637.1 sugar ABC transporter permease [Isoptericola sp. 178]MDO8149167.1 sugar ABC transporter permease [Isoptericola sp. b515]
MIFLIVLFPAGYMIYNSTREISQSGVDRGAVGLANYLDIFANSALPRVLLNTVVWVVVVVALTVVLSLALANFLDKQFPGRQLVRLAVIVPWAASVVMTSTVVYYSLQPNYGIVNHFLADIGILDVGDYGFTRNVVPAFIVAILVAVFVSLPFTTYTILAGLQSIPHSIVEAARMDGAGPVRTYFSVILPQLRPAVAVATIINIINVFNNVPIIRIMTGSIPGYDADITTTLIFKLIQTDRRVDLASALSVVNFAIVVLVIVAYMRIVKPMKGVDE